MKHKLLSAFCLMLACAMLLLTACSGGGNTGTEETTNPVQTTQSAVTVTDGQSEAGSEYVCPIDFAAYQSQNEDVYAWLDIPGSEISYPVFQHPTENEYYLRRDINGNYSVGGVLFTEVEYNKKDFNDPLTIIYGHDMQNETMFGQLQEMYSSDEGLAKYNTIKIYLPDRELTYEVFACVPYDNRHILYNYDFNDTEIFGRFFTEISQIRAMQAVFGEVSLKTTDKVLVLSTCLSGSSDGRYLVCAKLV